MGEQTKRKECESNEKKKSYCLPLMKAYILVCVCVCVCVYREAVFKRSGEKCLGFDVTIHFLPSVRLSMHPPIMFDCVGEETCVLVC